MPKVTGPIETTGSSDTFPTHDSRLGKGGLREVATTAERDAIPTDRRRGGMLVYVAADSSYYSLGDNLTTWGPLTLDGAGDAGWSPLLSVVSDGERRVLKIVDWVGGEGTKPSTSNQFLGTSGIVGTAAAAADVRGSTGAKGDKGDTGNTGPATTLSGVTITTTDPIDEGGVASGAFTGSAPNQGLTLVLPTGPRGAPGSNGVDAHPIYVGEANVVSAADLPPGALLFEYLVPAP